MTPVHEPVYLQLDRDPVFAVLHRPSADAARAVGVVLCAPFGWEEICAHRSFLRWAESLAESGYATLRFDLPGTGDSGGSPRDPQRVASWTDAVSGAASWLKATANCERVVAIGVGLGGMLAYLALADEAPIDDLVLWSVPAQGRQIVRELRAMARLAADQDAGPAAGREAVAAAEGELEVYGFVMSQETTDALSEIDLTALELSNPSERRVLLLGRDNAGVDQSLVEHLERCGVAVTSSAGPGYEAMLTQPKVAETPQKTIAIVTAWLGQPAASRAGGSSTRRIVKASDHADIAVGDASVRETPFSLDVAGGTLRGVLTEPLGMGETSDSLCAVLLNCGAIRRIGVNRMWVEASRRWATRGVSTLRLDLLGLGDSDGDEVPFRHPDAFYRTEFCGQVVAALDGLEAAGHSGPFALSGLCAGAYWSFQTALVDERVQGALLVNLWRFSTASELDAGRLVHRARQLHRSGELWSTVRDAFAEGTLREMAGAVVRNPQKVVARGDRGEISAELEQQMAQLHERHVATLMLLSLGEPIGQDIADAGLDETEPWPGVVLERIPLRDHNFRPVWAQEFVHDALDRGLERAHDAAVSRLATS
jgi:pimeloyl-ACP methyl ester carboxylesterase